MPEAFSNSDLRQLLIESIRGVKNGSIDCKQGNSIAALSSQLINSAKLDLEAARVYGHKSPKPIGLVEGPRPFEEIVSDIHDYLTENGTQKADLIAKKFNVDRSQLVEFLDGHPWFTVNQGEISVATTKAPVADHDAKCQSSPKKNGT